MCSGEAGYKNYQQWLAGTQLEQRSLEDYSVSNRGLAGPGRHSPASARPLEDLAFAGVDLLLLQCSPQLEEMERFSSARHEARDGDRIASSAMCECGIV